MRGKSPLASCHPHPNLPPSRGKGLVRRFLRAYLDTGAGFPNGLSVLYGALTLTLSQRERGLLAWFLIAGIAVVPPLLPVTGQVPFIDEAISVSLIQI